MMLSRYKSDVQLTDLIMHWIRVEVSKWDGADSNDCVTGGCKAGGCCRSCQAHKCNDEQTL